MSRKIKFVILKKQIENIDFTKGDFYSEDTGEFLHWQDKYSISLSSAENLNSKFKQ